MRVAAPLLPTDRQRVLKRSTGSLSHSDSHLSVAAVALHVVPGPSTPGPYPVTGDDHYRLHFKSRPLSFSRGPRLAQTATAAAAVPSP